MMDRHSHPQNSPPFSAPVRVLKAGQARVEVFQSKLDASIAAARQAASLLTTGESKDEPESRRIVVATGNSQEDFIRSLAQIPSIDWLRVKVFHMDEYVGLSDEHPASFRRWIRTHLVDVVHPGEVNYLSGDALALEEECRRYEGLLLSSPIDLCFLGFGENGHVAFNDPPNCDFNDPLVVKKVRLDERCRLQQVGEGHFPDLESVPAEALTLTCPFLMRSKCLICCVPERRKAEAVRNAIEGPISARCPASLVRTHPRAFIYLDAESASMLTG